MKHGIKDISLLEKIKNNLFYTGIDKNAYKQIQNEVAAANLKALKYWSVLVSVFWVYCICMSFFARDYEMCRPAYIISLCSCILSFFCSRFIIPRFPKTLRLFKFIFRLSLLGGGIGIAVCQWNLRSLTLFAVALISPSIFIDSTVSSLAVHCAALVIYFFCGRNTISPDIFYWGLNNYMLFSVFGLLIGIAINKERSERYVYAEYEKQLAEMQMRYAFFDRMTGLKNRHAYEDMLTKLSKDMPDELCIVMADINGLKVTNDTIGHKAGDELITGASECLSAAFEGIDTVFRIGGDEFCIILFEPIEKAQLCLTRLEELSAKWHGSYIDSLSVSTGVASIKDHKDVESVFAEADSIMYENKRNYYMKRGINRIYH